MTAPMKDEALRALVKKLEAGLAGVTPGPWRVPGKKTPYIVRDAGPWPHDSYGTVQIGECGDWEDAELARFNLDRWLADAHHIANCSPDNIRALLDALTALEAENARLREGEAWQPIETVPKDGRSVELWLKETPGSSAHCFAPVSICDDGTWWDDLLGRQIEPFEEATHWRRLTPPHTAGAGHD